MRRLSLNLEPQGSLVQFNTNVRTRERERERTKTGRSEGTREGREWDPYDSTLERERSKEGLDTSLSLSPSLVAYHFDLVTLALTWLQLNPLSFPFYFSLPLIIPYLSDHDYSFTIHLRIALTNSCPQLFSFFLFPLSSFLLNDSFIHPKVVRVAQVDESRSCDQSSEYEEPVRFSYSFLYHEFQVKLSTVWDSENNQATKGSGYFLTFKCIWIV